MRLHTQEPWAVAGESTIDGQGAEILGPDGQGIGCTFQHDDGDGGGQYTSGEDWANAHRIVKCVNGMKNIKDPYKLVLAAQNVVIAYGEDVPEWIKPLFDDLKKALGLED